MRNRLVTTLHEPKGFSFSVIAEISTTTIYEKWQLVSSHTARRSFATNLYKSGFPSISVMQITGHKTESSFLKYIKVTKEEHAKMLMTHWQKNGNLLKVM